MSLKLLNTLRMAILLLATSSGNAAQADEQSSAWAQLKDGTAIAIMRHALAPGTGDPTEFVLNDCTTQRNLSDEGRTQSRSIGELFRGRGILNANILSSEWCRCLETARLLDIGKPDTFSALNSFFQNRSAAADQTRHLRQALSTWLRSESTPTVLVTHQVNISALTGSFTNSGEILIISLQGDDVVVLASIDTLN